MTEWDYSMDAWIGIAGDDSLPGEGYAGMARGLCPMREQGRFTFYAGAQGSFAHRLMWEAFFPTRGKEPKGDRWQPI